MHQRVSSGTTDRPTLKFIDVTGIYHRQVQLGSPAHVVAMR
ncbi:hypothetical protein [Mycolicibacterium komossense]|nr:hypothetical protein [Mycolicibacterium komossense]